MAMTVRPVTFRRVVRKNEILDGEPTIRGTRVSVRAIVLSHELYGNVEGVRDAFPTLTRADIEEALAFYGANREEIDGYIAQNDVDRMA